MNTTPEREAIKKTLETLSPEDRSAILNHLMRERISINTKKALKKKKAQGVKLGRPGMSREKKDRIIGMACSNQWSVRQIAAAVRESVAATQRAIKEAGDAVPPRARGRRFGQKLSKRATRKLVKASEFI